MLKVGVPSLLVAVLGVAAPFALGWGVGALLLPDRGVYVHAFLGAMLTATSVGITARVLQDLGHSQSAEARVIPGAAVIDDVLGLIILAVVGGVIAAADRGGVLSQSEVGLVLGKAVAFLFGALALGVTSRPKCLVRTKKGAIPEDRRVDERSRRWKEELAETAAPPVAVPQPAGTWTVASGRVTGRRNPTAPPSFHELCSDASGLIRSR
jgi:hypothetical protein